MCSREVVKAGDIVKVKVLEVDLPRKRIALTMRLSDDVAPAHKGKVESAGPRCAKMPRRDAQPAPQGAMAAALAKLRGETSK